jgi:magnesium transporter
MLRITRTETEGYRRIDSSEEDVRGAWINLVNPTQEELQTVSELARAPHDLLKAALDEEESSRIEIDEDFMLVITNIPKLRDSHTYDTLPLGILISPTCFITVCLEENDVLSEFCERTSRNFWTYKRTRFLFQILYRTATLYLRHLQQINRRTDEIERDLRQSMKNKELFQLLDLQKGLTYFTASLRSNKVVIEKLLRLCSNPNLQQLIKLREEDEDLLEDVKIEYDQAIEMVQMYGDILAGMMDAFASIISNNLNMVMKFLTSFTILLSIPTMVSSFFGMNVPFPFGLASHPLSFGGIFLVACVLSLVSAFVLYRAKMF